MLLPIWFPISHVMMLVWLVGFATLHSGMAALRPWAEAKIGARLYRVIFAIGSLGVAVPMIIFFFNHRYDGVTLWDLQGIPGIKLTIWILSLISFIFLYPATFNLLEVAAIQKPQVHLYETGIIRVTRHPQMVGQVIWCVAHALWLGTSFMLVASAGLIGHHLFAVWHGDRRMGERYGETFKALKARTSVIPFLAIARGHQTLELKEFLRPAYGGVLLFVMVFWGLHPILVSATSSLPW